MPVRVVSREAEASAIADFLTSVVAAPSGMVIEGEPGIGKTTLWLAALDRARESGLQVMSARAAEAESVLAYGVLTDLLDAVDISAYKDLPAPQRLAIDRVLLRADSDEPATDQRAVAAGFLGIIKSLADAAPVLIAIDDLQWLDPSSARVISFATRRLSGNVGVLGTVRIGPAAGRAASWLQLHRPEATTRIQLPPLSLGGLHAVISDRIGRSFSRPMMVRIHEISGGNPFYALELARAMDAAPTNAEITLPGTLTELVQARLGRLRVDVGEALLAAACSAAPTVELVAQAIRADTRRVVELLEIAEDKGIVQIDGNRLCFAHPLLARGVYTRAAPARRRSMHRRLAEIVEQPELQARHRALAAVSGDPQTLKSLDAAADMARIRGAPAAAAELLELASKLGGDTPERRIRLAGHHFNSGDGARARALLEATAAGPTPPPLRAEALGLLAVMSQLEGSLFDAADQLERALSDANGLPAMRAQILVSLSWVQIHIGQFAAAARSIADAVDEAERVGQPALLSQVLGMRVVVHLLLGNGLDIRSLGRALELEDHTAPITVMFRPTVQNAMVLAWTGQLDAAHQKFVAIRNTCIERGEESELVFLAFHSVLNEIWRADFAQAAAITDDAVERARRLDGELALSVALSVRALLAAYAGRENDARCDITEAIGPIKRCGSQLLNGWTVAALGFLEISLGNFQAAVSALEPMLGRIAAEPNATEIFAAWFVPDAVEAMVQLGRLDDAEPLVCALERNGRRLDRAWMLATGARCRAMMQAAHGEIDAAAISAQQAMAEHERLPMPFERARTQLLMGQLQRRQRLKEAAAATLNDALATFERLGTPLWAERVRAELDRANVGPRGTAALTPSEQRVAELAASGMTNRTIAATMFISPKTVEANLARVYAKLGIHSRAELGQHMSQLVTQR